MKSCQISKHIFLNFIVHLGDAISKNPGYLKLRKIRAAQTIAKTVIEIFSFNYFYKLSFNRFHNHKIVFISTLAH